MLQHKTNYVISHPGNLYHDKSYVTTITASLLHITYFISHSYKGYCEVDSLLCSYHNSSINTASSISTLVWYYSNTNNIDMVVTFISSTPSNSTACHFVTPDIIAEYCVTMAVSSIVFKL